VPLEQQVLVQRENCVEAAEECSYQVRYRVVELEIDRCEPLFHVHECRRERRFKLIELDTGAMAKMFLLQDTERSLISAQSPVIEQELPYGRINFGPPK
jgi:hypothetical protein